LALPLGADGSDGFCPFDGGTLELSGVFGGRPSFASSSAIRATSASIRATSAAIKASFLGQIRRRCHPKVDSYSRCRRNQKNTVPNTGPSSHPQTGREQLPRFASTDASTRSTPFARYSASLVMQWRRHMPDFIRRLDAPYM